MTEVTPHPLKTQGFHHFLILLFYDHPALRRAAFCAIMQKMTGLLRAALPLQFIPARGRKREAPSPGLDFLQLQFIPARGRKLDAVHLGIVLDDCNLSPQGDENVLARANRSDMSTLQFIPARGRKLVGLVIEVQAVLLQFIPARGRKLFLIDDDAVTVDCNLSPQGDGNAARLTDSSSM